MATSNIDINDLLRQCEKPFAFDEHGIIRKKDSEAIDSVFILKDAIRRRLTQIDSRWSTGTADLMGIQGDVVIMSGMMTFLGAQRTAVGTGKIQSTNYGKPVEGFALAREVSKAMKTAASDLLPRLATEWNIGSYLRQLPKSVTTDAEFKAWLVGQERLWETRYHWASNGKGALFWHLIKTTGLTWDLVKVELEPGRVLSGLRDITLSDVDAFTRLMVISLESSKP